MINPYYVPWWINTSNPFEVDEEPYNPYVDKNLLTDAELGARIEKYTPGLWNDAGKGAVHQAYVVEGQTIIPPWPEESKEFFSNPSNRARYLINNVKKLEPLKEISQLDNLNIGLREIYGWNVEESFEQAGKVGIPGMAASIPRMASSILTSLDDLSKNLNTSFENTFGDSETIYPFSSQSEKDTWKEIYQDKMNVLDKEKQKKEPDVLTIKALDDTAEFFENIAIKNLKAFERRHAKDLRYQAYNKYLETKPIGWFTTFESPRYFAETAISLIPSAVVMAAAGITGGLAGIPSGLAVGTYGHMPLQASGAYSEAYRWTMDKTNDELLARTNAAWSTAGQLTFVGITEKWGIGKVMKGLGLNNLQKNIQNKAFKTFYKSNLYEKNGEFSILKAGALRDIAEKLSKNKIIDKSTYHSLTTPFAEAFQEYVQYGGQVLSEAGYKDESMDILDWSYGIPMIDKGHPLVDATELHESTIGGFVFGSGVGAGTYFGKGKKLSYNENTNQANNILLNEYGVNTGVPNADLSDESAYNVPIIKGESRPTYENYLKELINPRAGEDATVVSRQESADTPLGQLIKRQSKYDNAAIAEKMAETINTMGKNEWDKVSEDTKNAVNSHLLGAIEGIKGRGGEDIINSKILRNNQNIAKDILDGKISFERIGKGKRGIQTKRGQRTLKIHDKDYANSVVKMYESEISDHFEGKNINENSTANYLEKFFGITIDKQLNKELKSSIQKNIEGEFTSSIQKQAEEDAERQVIEQMEKETIDVIKKKVGIKEYKTEKKKQKEIPKVIGQEAVLLTGDYANQKGVITAYDDKKELVNIKLPDGTRVGPVKSSDVALQMPTAPTKPTVSKTPVGIIGKVGETTVETKVDSKGRTLTYFATTKDKGGVKHTTYTFNRSDKKESQRNKGGVSPEVAFGDKYEIKKGELVENWVVDKVFEVREGDGVSADVTLINKATGEKLTDVSLVLQKKTPKSKFSKDVVKDVKKVINEVDDPNLEISDEGKILVNNEIVKTFDDNVVTWIANKEALGQELTKAENYVAYKMRNNIFDRVNKKLLEINKKYEAIDKTKDSISKDLDILSKEQDKLFGEADGTIALKVEEKLYDKYDLWNDVGDLPEGDELIKIEKTGLDYKEDWTGEKFSITEKAKEILNSSELKELQLNVDKVNNIEEQANKIIKKSKVSKKITTKKKPTAKNKLQQQVNKAIDALSTYNTLSQAIELQKAIGELNKKDLQSLQVAKNELSLQLLKDDVKQELSKQGKLKAIEKILGEDTPSKKKLHKIGDAYEKGEKKATKAFISKAVKEIMGKHSPEINKIFVSEIKESPSAVGAYSNGMVEFVLGRATQHTAYHEPIHWFMNRVLNDNDYNTVIQYFKGEEPATRAAADWYMGQKDRTLSEKISDIFRKFWIAIQKFLNMQVTKEDTIFDIFNRIGKDFTIRNFKDRMNEYDIGADVEFEDVQTSIKMYAISPSTFEKQLKKYINIPLSKYNPQKKTLDKPDFILQSPTAYNKYGQVSFSQVPSSNSSEMKIPYTYQFSKILFNQGNKISISSPFSTKNLSKYEKSVVDNFYKNIKDAEWTEGKKSIDKELLIKEYESYIEKEFPLNAYSVRHGYNNINKNGIASPVLFNRLLPKSENKFILDNFFSSRILLTDNNFYSSLQHSFSFDPTSVAYKESEDWKSIDSIETVVNTRTGQESSTEPRINGLGWYVYVEPRVKNIKDKQINKLAFVYEIQQDINDFLREKEDNSDIRTSLEYGIHDRVKQGQITPEEGARLHLIGKSLLFTKKRMDISTNITGDSHLIKNFIFTPSLYGSERISESSKHKLIHPDDMADAWEKTKLEMEWDINLTTDRIGDGIQNSIVNRLMTKIIYNETLNWNEFVSSKKMEYNKTSFNSATGKQEKIEDKNYYKKVKDFYIKKFDDIIKLIDFPISESGRYKNIKYNNRMYKIPVDEISNLQKMPSVISLLNNIKLRKKDKEYIISEYNKYNKKFPFEIGEYFSSKIGLNLKLRITLIDFLKNTSSVYKLENQPGIKLDYSKKTVNSAINKYWSSYFASHKERKAIQEIKNKKLIEKNRRLKWKLTNWYSNVSQSSKVAERYVNAYNRQHYGLSKALMERTRLFADDYSVLKSMNQSDSEKTQKLINDSKKFKEISIHHSILTAHQRGNDTWSIAGAQANLEIQGRTGAGIKSSKLYVNDYELNDFYNAKSYEEWKIKSLGTSRFPTHMSFVDNYFGQGKGNHLKSEEKLKEEFKKDISLGTVKIFYGPGSFDYTKTITERNNKLFLKDKSYPSEIEITFNEAIKLYKDAPKPGVIWTTTKKVLKKLNLIHQPKHFHEDFKAPIVIVKIPNDFNAVPIKRFHEIKEVPEFEKQENKSQELQRKTGAKDEITPIKETIVEDAVNLSRAVQNFNKPKIIKELFSASFNKIQNKYGIEVADYVPILSKSINRSIPDRENRDMVKNLLSEWAVSVDPDVGTKMSSNNKAIKIIDLMGLTGIRKRRISRQIADLDVVENIERTLEGQSFEDSHDVTREGLSVSNSTDMEEVENNNEINTYNFSDDRFFRFLEGTKSKGYLSPKQTAELMSEVVVKDFAEFTLYLSSKHGWEPTTTSDNNIIRSFWVKNQLINRQTGYDRPSWWYANVTYDGKVLSNKDDKRLVPKVGGHPKYGKDLRNNKDLPRTNGVSFLDWDNLSYNWDSGGDIKYSRMYLKDMVDVHKGEEKGGYFSTLSYVTLNGQLIRDLDKKFSQYANEEIGDKRARTIVAVKAAGNQPSFIIARASKDIMDISSEIDSIVDYLDYEVNIGNMTNDNKKEILISMQHETKKSPLNNYIRAQHILTHEVMKRARGRDYLIRTSSASHHSRRLGIDDGDGVVAVGVGDYTIKIIDQSKAFISKGIPNATNSSTKIPMSDYIAGLPNKYHGDGSLWVDSDYLDKTAYHIGRVPTTGNSSKLREIKTRIRFISKNDEFGNKNYKQEVIPVEGRPLATEEQIEGTHYLAMKHNEFVPEEDIYIVDENDNVIAYTANVDGSIYIYDAEDNRMTMFGTLDEAKEPDGGSGVFKLDGRVSTDILTLPEESRRIVKVPKQQGHNSAAFPWMWMSHLNNPVFNELRDSLLTRMLNVAKGNMNALFEARKNPQIMRSLMGQFKSDGLTVMSEIDRLIEPSDGEMIKDGFMYPHILTGILSPIKNRIIKENSYGGRRRGFGSFPVIKSDLSKTIVNKKDGVVLSGDDVTMVRFLKDFLNVEGFGNELINNINEALRTRKEYLIAGRWPAYTISSVFLARIEKVMPRGHGDVVWYHPESVIGKLQGDHDGDTSFLLAPYFGMNYMDKTVVNKFNTKEVKEAFQNLESFVRLEYFKKSNVNYKSTSKKDNYILVGKLGRGMNSQGMLMNAVTFMEDMYFKDLKMEIGGQKIVVRDPNKESIIMNYAKLNNDVTQEMLDLSKMGTLVNKDGEVWKDGDKYLRTTPLKQLHILLQAAVDNSKEFLLADWGFAGWVWIAPRIFIQDNGSPIGSKQANTISSLVRKQLMINVSRRGVDTDTNRTQDIEGMFESSKEMYRLNEMSGVERGMTIKDKANLRRIKYGESSKLAKRTHPINKIIFNNKLLPLERLISIPHESLVLYEQSNPDDKVHNHPLGYHPNRIQRGIMHTQQDMYTLQKETERWYPENKEFEKDKEIARRFTNEMGREFYRIAMKNKMYNDSTKSRITSAGFPYQDEIVKFIDKWLNKTDKKYFKKVGLPSWNELSEQQQAYSSLRFLRGILTYSTQTHKKVGDFEKRLFNKLIDLKSKLNEEIDLGKVERIESNIAKVEKQLDNIYTPATYQNMSRPRDIEKVLPMPLMHPGVWRTYANLFGPNLRRASSERISLKADARYENRKRRIVDEILKECN